jgi:hypothetical protein
MDSLIFTLINKLQDENKLGKVRNQCHKPNFGVY